MKRKLVMLMLVILSMLFSGCLVQVPKSEAKAASNMQAASQAVETNEWYKLEDYDKAINLLDQHFKNAWHEKTMVNKNSEIQIVKLERLNENYFLAAYQTSPVHPLTNLNYALVGFQENSCRTINLDTADYISDVTYENGVISFHCEGNNIINAFRVFPHKINYDIEKNTTSVEQLYYSLNSGSQVRLGNSINKASFGEITEKDKDITFDFEVTNETVLAGGYFCPAIKAGVMFDKEDKPVFYLDFENVFLSKDAEKAIMDLAHKEYISNIEIKELKDIADLHHTVIYFEFKDVSFYTCSFKHEGDTGFQSLVLSLK